MLFFLGEELRMFRLELNWIQWLERSEGKKELQVKIFEAKQKAWNESIATILKCHFSNLFRWELLGSSGIFRPLSGLVLMLIHT